MFRISLKGTLFTGAFVAVSSFLGLTGLSALSGNVHGALKFIVEIWSISLLADLVFVMGSAAAAVLSFKVARRSNVFASVGLSLFLNCLVYAASYLTISVTHQTNIVNVKDVLEVVGVVTRFGGVGLIFAALAPAVAAGRPRVTRARLHPRSSPQLSDTQASA